MSEPLKIGLALSGGGSRAMAFHLGCLRALHDKGILSKITVLSSVSGGSVIAALYAYSDDSFPEFEARVEKILRHGLAGGIARQTLFSLETPKIVAAVLISGSAALFGGVFATLLGMLSTLKLGRTGLQKLAEKCSAPIPRFASRTTAFERHLRKSVFGDRNVDEVCRPGLRIVINAAELRTGTAFRYGSGAGGSWRYGRLVGNTRVSKAVAASAAFPALLPCFDEYLTFEKSGVQTKHRVMITDGGVYDNLGISCLLPGRNSEFTSSVFDINFIIACDAGQGMPSGKSKPYFWGSRMLSTVTTIHRRTHTLSYDLLHRMAATGAIKGFILPYMGQIDDRLPEKPIDLVPRSTTFDYPTDFSPMPRADLNNLKKRGEQLTAILVNTYGPKV